MVYAPWGCRSCRPVRRRARDDVRRRDRSRPVHRRRLCRTDVGQGPPLSAPARRAWTRRRRAPRLRWPDRLPGGDSTLVDVCAIAPTAAAPLVDRRRWSRPVCDPLPAPPDRCARDRARHVAPTSVDTALAIGADAAIGRRRRRRAVRHRDRLHRREATLAGAVDRVEHGAAWSWSSDSPAGECRSVSALSRTRRGLMSSVWGSRDELDEFSSSPTESRHRPARRVAPARTTPNSPTTACGPATCAAAWFSSR